MGRYAVIDSGQVTNVIEAGEEFATMIAADHDLVLAVDDVVPPPSIGWTYADSVFAAPPFDVAKYVNGKLKSYQLAASGLLRDLYTENTLAGISEAQSDQMFDDFADVLLRIREGAFPTALYRLATKTPVGFVTQPLLDVWTAKIKAYL